MYNAPDFRKRSLQVKLLHKTYIVIAPILMQRNRIAG